MKVCSIPGCGKVVMTRGYCSMHYARVRRHGDPYYKPGPRIPIRPDGLIICFKCKLPKDPSEFTKKASRSNGLDNYCKECKTFRQRKNYHENPDYKRWHKAYHIAYRFGMSSEEWVALYEKQGGVCAVCKEPETGKNERLSVDHDHETGKIRGLLCNTCNRGLGLLKDSVTTLSAAVEYLKRTGSDSGPEQAID